VFVGGVDAYSTLGWFSDPVLSTFIGRDETGLAELVFHELAHQRLFVAGDTDFNEAFATAVAREGVRRWLRDRGDPEAVEAWARRMEREDAFLSLVLGARKSLERLYTASSDTIPEGGGSTAGMETGTADRLTMLQEGKVRVFNKLRADYESLKLQWHGGGSYDAWFALPVNNARLNAESTYHALVPAFDRLLERCGGDFDLFFIEVKALGKLPMPARQVWLRQFL
jgi:predicted aminopeptidase